MEHDNIGDFDLESVHSLEVISQTQINPNMSCNTVAAATKSTEPRAILLRPSKTAFSESSTKKRKLVGEMNSNTEFLTTSMGNLDSNNPVSYKKEKEILGQKDRTISPQEYHELQKQIALLNATISRLTTQLETLTKESKISSAPNPFPSWTPLIAKPIRNKSTFQSDKTTGHFNRNPNIKGEYPTPTDTPKANTGLKQKQKPWNNTSFADIVQNTPATTFAGLRDFGSSQNHSSPKKGAEPGRTNSRRATTTNKSQQRVDQQRSAIGNWPRLASAEPTTKANNNGPTRKQKEKTHDNSAISTNSDGSSELGPWIQVGRGRSSGKNATKTDKQARDQQTRPNPVDRVDSKSREQPHILKRSRGATRADSSKKVKKFATSQQQLTKLISPKPEPSEFDRIHIIIENTRALKGKSNEIRAEILASLLKFFGIKNKVVLWSLIGNAVLEIYVPSLTTNTVMERIQIKGATAILNPDIWAVPEFMDATKFIEATMNRVKWQSKKSNFLNLTKCIRQGLVENEPKIQEDTEMKGAGEEPDLIPGSSRRTATAGDRESDLITDFQTSPAESGHSDTILPGPMEGQDRHLPARVSGVMGPGKPPSRPLTELEVGASYPPLERVQEDMDIDPITTKGDGKEQNLEVSDLIADAAASVLELIPSTDDKQTTLLLSATTNPIVGTTEGSCTDIDERATAPTQC
jgi:hypothetical protein